MKTSTIHALAASFALAAIAGFSGTKVTGDYLTGIAVAVSYLAVAALVALAASDYRSRQRDYQS